MKKDNVILALGAIALLILLGGAFMLGRVTANKSSESMNSNKEVFKNTSVVNDEDTGEFIQTHDTSDQIEIEKEEAVNETVKETNKIEIYKNVENNVQEEKVETISLSSSDKDIISEIESIDSATMTVLDNENSESASQKAKGVFITLVDFVFYDGKIKGITFDELTDAGKEKVLKLVSVLDDKIENKIPGYKEHITEGTKFAYNKASEVIKDGASNINEFSKEKLGEDNYNAIIDAKDELVSYTKYAVSIIKSNGSSIWEKATSKLKSWYEKFRNS